MSLETFLLHGLKFNDTRRPKQRLRFYFTCNRFHTSIRNLIARNSSVYLPIYATIALLMTRAGGFSRSPAESGKPPSELADLSPTSIDPNKCLSRNLPCHTDTLRIITLVSPVNPIRTQNKACDFKINGFLRLIVGIRSRD